MSATPKGWRSTRVKDRWLHKDTDNSIEIFLDDGSGENIYIVVYTFANGTKSKDWLFDTKIEAKSFAIKYMREHPRG